MAQPRFGELLWQALHQVKAKTHRSMTAIKRDLAEWCYVGIAAVNNWKKRSLPPEQTIERLARWAVQTAGMEREWLVAFLRAGDYNNGGPLVNELFGADKSELPVIRENLPPLRSDFIGRIKEIGRVREGLTMPYPVISIEGIGGVGKTTLAIKVANMCKSGEINEIEHVSDYGGGFPVEQIEPFEAFVWISAKDKQNNDLSLGEVLDTIASVLNYSIVCQLHPNEKIAAVDRLLRAHRTLVIVDNFETVTDITLAHFLQRVPPPSKAIITTRTRQLRRLWDVPLYGLSQEEAIQKIHHYSYSLGLRTVAKADEKILQPLIAIGEGNPKALEMALGYIKYKGMALDEVVRSLVEANKNVEELFQDLFARAWDLLSEEGQRLLTVMPFFADSASRDALEAAADVHGWYLRMGISQLIGMSLLETTEELVEERKRYSAHPLVIAFGGAKLREKAEFEAHAREQWSEFYLQYVEEYGHDDFGKSIGQNQRKKLRLEINNLERVIGWCFQKRNTKTVRLVERITKFLNEEGYWSQRINLSRQALIIADTPDSQAGLLAGLGWSYLILGHYENSRSTLDKGLSLAKQHNLQDKLVPLLRYSGRWYSLQNEYDTASDLYIESMELAKNIDQEIGILLAQAFSARTAYIRGNYEEAKQGFIQLLPKFKETHPRQWLFTLRFLGDIAIREGNLDEARNYLQKALECAETLYYQAHEMVKLDRSLGNLEKASGNLSSAVEYYQNALDLATRSGMRKEIEELEASIREMERLVG